ncbi:MAG TPA: UTP--glucose-1-phosphate uridylyltransferase GalU [Patescibacteria group bacterium]|nr:UTP--glucose-1-phosphate uridylyltransferase GalU [Patescibacteria group bacterium]
MKIRKAIIPVAGFGTRFLPATKAQPKEMLTMVDKPVIQYIVEEAVASGIRDIILITGQNKRAIEDHFDRNFELEYRLRQQKKDGALKEVQKISDMANFIYIRQKTPLGDGHAILAAKELIQDDEPVAILYGDDVVDARVPVLKQLIDVYEKYQDPVIGVMKVQRKNVSKYGVVDAAKLDKHVWQVNSLVEKPKPEEAPSNLAVAGRYVITPEIFWHLERVKKGKGGEIRLIDGFRSFIKKRSVYACEFEGQRFDCGDKLEFLKATVHYGLKHHEFNSDFAKYLKTVGSNR